MALGNFKNILVAKNKKCLVYRYEKKNLYFASTDCAKNLFFIFQISVGHYGIIMYFS
jgi:hypothetical protein